MTTILCAPRDLECRVLSNSHGQSLIQVLISVAIMSLLTSIFSSMFYTQTRQSTALSEKMAARDVERVVTMALSDASGVCTYMVNNPVLAAFDPAAVGPTYPTFNFAQIPVQGIAGAPSAVTVSATTPASPLANNLYANGIQLVDFACVPGPCSPTSNTFTANIDVTWDNSKTASVIRSLKFPVTLNTTGPANSQTIVGCANTTSTPVRNWIDVTLGRSTLTNYVNTTAHDIEVSVSVFSGTPFLRCGISILVNGVNAARNFNNGAANQECNATVTVPPGATYSADNTLLPAAAAGENMVQVWSELR